MHFWVSTARVGRPGMAPGHLSTSGTRSFRKMGTNWFMPALVKSRPGESGIRLDDGTMVCPLDLKKSKNDCRISADVMPGQYKACAAKFKALLAERRRRNGGGPGNNTGQSISPAPRAAKAGLGANRLAAISDHFPLARQHKSAP